MRCHSYDEDVIQPAVERVLAPLGELARFVSPGMRVLVKLNLLSAAVPERAVTTHPALVRAVVRQVQALGATPIVGDSPGGLNTPAAYAALLAKTGIRQVIEETGCEWVHFDARVTEYTSERARRFKKLTVAMAPLEADAVICLPKLKTHQFALYTGAVKLLYGYLPGLKKAEYHLHAGKHIADFAELLLDICETFPPTLSIMDAVVGMEGQGPSHGTPRPVGLLLASESCTALDYVMTHLIGLDPLAVPTVRAAVHRGIGPGTLADVTLHGEDPAAVRVPDFRPADTLKPSLLPPWLADISSWLFAPRPVINEERCVKCGTCAENCPPQAMHWRKGTPPRIDHRACLRCYCCHELCPADAVRIAPPRVRLP